MSVIQPEEIYFSSPRPVTTDNFTCYYQNASMDSKPLYVETSSFYSRGLNKSKFSDQMQLRIPEECTSTLIQIDEKAKQALKCPPNFAKKWRKDFENKEIYKSLPYDKLFLKFSADWKCFNKEGEVIDIALTAGNYRLVLHVIGIYIGNHGSTPYLASLQVKIKQVEFEPEGEESMFSKSKLCKSRGVVSPKLHTETLPEAVGDDFVSPAKKVKVSSLSSNSSCDGDTEDDDELRVRSKKIERLLEAYRLNNYPTQQPTEEEQIEHDKYLDSLDSELCDFLGEEW